MPRTFTGNMPDKRVSISLAALLVKVTANTPPGDTCPDCMSHAMRVVSTRVLPEPAPAKIKPCSAGKVTAADCSSLRPCNSGDALLKKGDCDSGAAVEWSSKPEDECIRLILGGLPASQSMTDAQKYAAQLVLLASAVRISHRAQDSCARFFLACF